MFFGIDTHKTPRLTLQSLSEHYPNEGITKVLSADTGSSASGGGDEHRYILQESYKAFTQLGARTSLPTQEGASLPDGLAELPIDPMDGAGTVHDVEERKQQLKDEFPRLYEVSNCQHVAIEAETSTIDKPMQTLTNLRKAIETDRYCIFACKDATFDTDDEGKSKGRDITYWPKRGESVIYESTQGNINYDEIFCCSSIDDQGNRVFYNKTSKFELDEGVYAVRAQTPASNSLTWKEKGQAQIVAVTDDGDEVARFDNPEDVADPSLSNVTAFRKQDDDGDWLVQQGNTTHGPYQNLDDLRERWQDLYAPFIPENEYPRMPTEDDFQFLVFPDGENPDYDEPMLYQKGEMEPLFKDQDYELTERQQPSEKADNTEDETVEAGNQPAESTKSDRQEKAEEENNQKQPALPMSESTESGTTVGNVPSSPDDIF